MSASTEAEKTAAGMTEYVVCTVHTGEPARIGETGAVTYHEVGRVTAKTPVAAIKAKKDGDGTYVAIPVRHLKPHVLKVSMVEQVELS